MVAPKKRATPDAGDDSDATDPEMPELLPPEPPKYPAVKSQAGKKRGAPGGLGPAALLQRLRDAAAAATSRAFVSPMLPEIDEVTSPPARPGTQVQEPAITLPESPPRNAAPRMPTGGQAFGERANALAAVLDKLSPSLPTTEEASLEVLAADTTPCTTRLKASCRWEDCLDEIEVSAAAKRKAAASLDEEWARGLEDTDSEEDEDDEEDEGFSSPQKKAKAAAAVEREKRAAKRRRTDKGEVFQKPPGAPEVAPAAWQVRAAVAVAGGEERAEATRVAQLPESAATGPSFGPRFQGLTETALAAVRSKWTLHSLADVQTTSSQDNQRAAASLFDELRKRREGGGAAATAAPEGASQADSSPTAAPGKPTFRRPPPRELAAEAAERRAAGARMLSPGVFVAEECLAGVGRKKPSDTAVQPPRRSAPPSKVRAVCAGMEDSGEA